MTTTYRGVILGFAIPILVLVTSYLPHIMEIDEVLGDSPTVPQKALSLRRKFFGESEGSNAGTQVLDAKQSQRSGCSIDSR
uniref:Uncharacterized protein n=1 Tax=Arundo donax TaxID=35708 RepID=A0A0A9B4V5_ARUDO